MRARRESRLSKASRIQRSRIGSALVCVRRNVQHREPKLPESTRFVLVTDLMDDMSTSGPTDYVVTPLPFLSQSAQSHGKAPASHSARGETPTLSLALGANREGKEKVEGNASRIQNSRIWYALLVCVRRNAQHRELNLPRSTRFVFIAAVMIAVSPNGLTGCLLTVSPPSLSITQKTPSRPWGSLRHSEPTAVGYCCC